MSKSKAGLNVEALPKSAASVGMTSADAQETYELLRASHTLLRMAFGACTMIATPKDEDDAKEITSHFDFVFDFIRKSAHEYARIYKEASAKESGAAN